MFEVLRAQNQLIKSALLSRAAVPVLTLLLFNGVNRLSLEIARNIYYAALVRKVSRQIKSKGFQAEAMATTRPSKPNVWVYWDAGFESAPPIIQLCAARLKDFEDIKVVFLDNQNLSEYVALPSHILSKFADGRISKAHFSDLLRLELLHFHGGIWLDATVLLTGKEFPQELLSEDLFFYAMSKPSSNGNPIYVSSWAMTSTPGHPTLSIARQYLIDYWKTQNKLKDYFLLHVVLCAAMNAFPEYRPKRLGFYNNADPHRLLLNIHEPYNKLLFDEITVLSDIHKLTYKYDAVRPGSVIDHILNGKGAL